MVRRIRRTPPKGNGEGVDFAWRKLEFFSTLMGIVTIYNLHQLCLKETRIVAGIMSGTSVDAIDVALCAIKGAGSGGILASGDRFPPAEVSLLSLASYPYSSELSSRIREMVGDSTRILGRKGVQEISELNVRIGEEFGDVFLKAVKEWGGDAASVDLIGSHGQTVYHHSRRSGAIRSTLQLGCGEVIAERTGRPVYFNFRARDIARGGEGAPLTPYADYILFGAHRGVAGRAVLNLGGIANLTILTSDISGVRGFDCGPANAPLDRLARIVSGGSLAFDKDGALARQGKVNVMLLEELLRQDPFLSLPPPKSTGFESYGDAFVSDLVARHGKADSHLVATVTEFVASCIGESIRRYCAADGITELLIAGGGGRNPALVEAIARVVAPCQVALSDTVGVSSAAREAMAFAVLANDALFSCRTSLPAVTGAQRAGPLGTLAFP